ncbi:hypothetical protein ACQPXM_31065 [Kribbella sp. CA-253562]|uniref:hypothetical protein n=1 Tax=Kribbella sp. CA-253562 TaxID=3239942 RepID=UPI003D919ABD
MPGVEARQTNQERILTALHGRTIPLNDDELSAVTGVKPRQAVNQICRALAEAGVIARGVGAGGKLVNWIAQPVAETALSAEPEAVGAATGQPAAEGLTVEEPTADGSVLGGHAPELPKAETAVPPPTQPGSSAEQRMAEGVMLRELGSRLGVTLTPTWIRHPTGARVQVDGMDVDRTVLVECWAHQGPAKVAQKSKLVNDAVKLHWIAQSLPPAAARRLILCVTDALAVSHLTQRSWQRHAIAELGVEIEVVQLPDDLVQAIRAAQVRQFR